MRINIGFASVSGSAAFLGLLVLLGACSGTANVTIGDGGTQPSSGNDAAVTGLDSGTGGIADGSPGSDASPQPVAAGFVVKDEPAPTCSDLAQKGSLVTTTSDPGNPPDPTMITAIPPGLYVITAITDYGNGTTTTDAASRTTAYFDGTHEYYVRDDSTGNHSAYTLTYKVTGGTLVRTVLCASQPVGTLPAYQLGASTNGFTVFIDLGGGTETVRYERAP